MQNKNQRLDRSETIWNQIRQGDKDGLKELYQLYYDDLYRYGKRFTREETIVEDALQETFLSIWKYRKTISQPASVKFYLQKTFRHQVLKLLDEQKRFAAGIDDHPFTFEISFEQQWIAGEETQSLSRHINTAIQELTGRQREIIYYRFFENLSFEEIAGLMNLQVRGSYKLMSRALAALKAALKSNSFKVWQLLCCLG